MKKKSLKKLSESLMKQQLNSKSMGNVFAGADGTCGTIVSTDTKSGTKLTSDDCDYDNDCTPIVVPDTTIVV
ncbi:MAG: hypothetical protein KA734_03200 [Fluviicola sp.]|nr:hypothetical protein [Fluviicola sp.]MBP6270930.1 hypothetical protein [Fluviicola sp.]